MFSFKIVSLQIVKNIFERNNVNDVTALQDVLVLLELGNQH